MFFNTLYAPDVNLFINFIVQYSACSVSVTISCMLNLIFRSKWSRQEFS